MLGRIDQGEIRGYMKRDKEEIGSKIWREQNREEQWRLDEVRRDED